MSAADTHPAPHQAVGHLTGFASSFIGRRSEIAAIAEWVATGQRLIALVGPPGVGKTRLACRLGEGLRSAPRRGELW